MNHPVSEQWTRWKATIDLAEYNSRWERLAATGQETHGEADFIASYSPKTVLDAGCGMGRVAIELHRRGIDTVGVDLDDEMLTYARDHAPSMTWIHGDLATMELGRAFDIVAMPGNVMIFCRPGDRGPILDAAVRHLLAGGRLIAGFTLDRGADALTLDEYDGLAALHGLSLVERFATWDRQQFTSADRYAVSVHQRPIGLSIEDPSG